MPGGARDESEARTRRSRVDPMLKQQGWSIVPFDPSRPTRHYSHHAVTEFPTANGPADHALFVEGQPLRIVEAKRLNLGPQNMLPQAERSVFGRVPILDEVYYLDRAAELRGPLAFPPEPFFMSPLYPA